MDDSNFKDLMRSVREGGQILRGDRLPSRRFTMDANTVRAIRERTQLSQGDFAKFVGVSVKTLQNWEQNRRKPAGPAAALLRLISEQPHLVRG